MTSLKDRTLGLAGVFQAASLVKQLARTGRVPESFFRSSIDSLFKIDAIDAEDVFGGINNVKLGLQELTHLFMNNQNAKDADIARYALSLLHLERKLAKEAAMKKMLQAGINRALQQSKHFGTTHENVMANLASIYTDTLSTFKFRIYVTGEPIYLNQNQTMNKIRSLLLAGIRSAVLWQQMGGRRWQLLFARNTIIQSAKHCLTSIQTELEETI